MNKTFKCINLTLLVFILLTVTLSFGQALFLTKAEVSQPNLELNVKNLPAPQILQGEKGTFYIKANTAGDFVADELRLETNLSPVQQKVLTDYLETIDVNNVVSWYTSDESTIKLTEDSDENIFSQSFIVQSPGTCIIGLVVKTGAQTASLSKITVTIKSGFKSVSLAKEAVDGDKTKVNLKLVVDKDENILNTVHWMDGDKLLSEGYGLYTYSLEGKKKHIIDASFLGEHCKINLSSVGGMNSLFIVLPCGVLLLIVGMVYIFYRKKIDYIEIASKNLHSACTKVMNANYDALSEKEVMNITQSTKQYMAKATFALNIVQNEDGYDVNEMMELFKSINKILLACLSISKNKKENNIKGLIKVKDVLIKSTAHMRSLTNTYEEEKAAQSKRAAESKKEAKEDGINLRQAVKKLKRKKNKSAKQIIAEIEVPAKPMKKGKKKKA